MSPEYQDKSKHSKRGANVCHSKQAKIKIMGSKNLIQQMMLKPGVFGENKRWNEKTPKSEL